MLQALQDPTRYVGLNAAWQLRGDRALIRSAAQHADVLGVVEARRRDNTPVPVRDYLIAPFPADLGRGSYAGWDVGQDLRDGARSGSAIAVRRGRPVRLRRVSTWVASRAGSWRTSVQTRYLKVGHLVDHGIRTRVFVVHFPTESSGQQPQARRSLRRAVRRAERAGVRWMAIGDFNTDVAALARELGASGHGVRDVMGVIWGAPRSARRDGRGWGQIVVTHRRHPGSDHAVLTATETHRRVPRRSREVP